MASDRSVQQSGNEGSILQPGFRFAPNDEELLCFYLTKKVEDNNIAFDFIGEVDFNKCEPWHLLAWAKTRLMDETVFYFFSKLEKCGTGTRNKRTTEAGYWKITGEDRDVKTRCTGMLVGKKRTLAFYTGQAPKGERTGWTMCEYRIEGESTVAHHQDWVVLKFFDKPREKLLRGPPRSSPSGRESLLPSPNKNSNAGPNPQGGYHGSGHESRDITLLHSKGSDGSVTPRDSGFDLDGVLQKQHESEFSDGSVYRMDVFPELSRLLNATSDTSPGLIGEPSSPKFISDADLDPSDPQGSDHGATHLGHEGHDGTQHRLVGRVLGRGKDKRVWNTALRDVGFSDPSGPEDLFEELFNPDVNSQTLTSLSEVFSSPNVACYQSDPEESCHEAINFVQESHNSQLPRLKRYRSQRYNSTLKRSKGSWSELGCLTECSLRQGVMAGPPSGNSDDDHDRPFSCDLDEGSPTLTYEDLCEDPMFKTRISELAEERIVSEEADLGEWESFENDADDANWWGTLGVSSVGHFLVFAWRWTWFKLGRCMCVSVD